VTVNWGVIENAAYPRAAADPLNLGVRRRSDATVRSAFDRSFYVPFDTIDGICPDCGLTRMDLLGSGLWDGWSGPELLPASGVCYTGRCQRCGAILETLLEGDEEPNSVIWAAVDDQQRERMEWMLSGREGWPPE
jgi:hypothetical protein